MKAVNGNIDANHDYGYINFFIDCLERIIKIIKDLFSSIGGKDDTTAPEKDDSSANP